MLAPTATSFVEDFQRGREQFHALGCASCHVPMLVLEKPVAVLDGVPPIDLAREMRQPALTYDPAAGTWTDLAPKEQPSSRGCKFGLVYDSRNDVAILTGGGTGWNKGWRNDLWAYVVKENRWEKLNPVLAGGAKGLPAFTDNMPSGYDERHNAVIFTEGNSPWAYRYKK
jgi:hypothetical protein